MKAIRLILFSAIIVVPMLLCKKPLNDLSYKSELNIATITPQLQFKKIGGDTLTPDLRITAFIGVNLQYFLDSCEIIPPSTAIPHVERNVVVNETLRRRYGWTLGDTIDYVWFWCQTENIAPPAYRPQTGKWEQNNFVFLESNGEKIYLDSNHHSYYFILPGLIKNGTWVDSGGLLVNKFPSNYKLQFEPSIDYFTPRYPREYYVYYNDAGYLAIQAWTYDIYFNLFRIPRGYNGKVVFNPTINPEYAEDQRVSHESNYDNNTTLLPFNVQGPTGTPCTYDPSAIAQIVPVTNLTEIHNLKGNANSKFVTINWQSTNTWFCLHRTIYYANGSNSGDVELPDVYNATTYTDISSAIKEGNVKEIRYTIYSMAEGLPVSTGNTISIKK